MYKLARQAMRYGQHPIASELFTSLSHLVSTGLSDEHYILALIDT